LKLSKIKRLSLQEVERRLQAWEEKFGFDSSEIEARLADGRLQDTADVALWLFDKAVLKHLQAKSA
jgi:hypothetical protein